MKEWKDWLGQKVQLLGPVATVSGASTGELVAVEGNRLVVSFPRPWMRSTPCGACGHELRTEHDNYIRHECLAQARMACLACDCPEFVRPDPYPAVPIREYDVLHLDPSDVRRKGSRNERSNDVWIGKEVALLKSHSIRVSNSVVVNLPAAQTGIVLDASYVSSPIAGMGGHRDGLIIDFGEECWVTIPEAVYESERIRKTYRVQPMSALVMVDGTTPHDALVSHAVDKSRPNSCGGFRLKLPYEVNGWYCRRCKQNIPDVRSPCRPEINKE